MSVFSFYLEDNFKYLYPILDVIFDIVFTSSLFFNLFLIKIQRLIHSDLKNEP